MLLISMSLPNCDEEELARAPRAGSKNSQVSDSKF